MTHFKIVVPMYNCSRFVAGCLDSVFRQMYQDWQLVVIIEPCDDDTYAVVYKYLAARGDSRVLMLRNEKRQYVPKNHVDGIRMSKPANDDVIVLLDGDDALYGDDVLSYLDSVYQDESVWVTWGSYIFEHSNKKGLASLPIPEGANGPGPREWRYSHLKTFRYFLFKGVQDKDLRDTLTGDYYKVTGDMALMFPLVEMAGREHGRYLDKVLYVYNLSSPFNDEKVHGREQKRCHAEIHSRQPYLERTKEELCQLP